MNVDFDPDELLFREEIRDFLDHALPSETRRRVLNGLRVGKDRLLEWHQILHRKEWIAPSWPVEFGGPGWSAVQQHIFEEECTLAGAPTLPRFGLRMVAPVIMRFGNREQQQHFLPKILSGEHWWCQGYSEPGAGSDLAALSMRATRDGDHYVVNGQKTWTTLAHYANWIFCLVRTNSEVSKQQGISFLLIDMSSPGVNVRPIITIDGEHEVNEVWFDDVHVPVAQLVGEENKGWTYAKFLLGHERTGLAGIARAKRDLVRLKDIASRELNDAGVALLRDRPFARRIAAVEARLAALEITNLRVLSDEAQRRAPGAIASLLKITGTEIQQALTELMLEALGPRATAHQPEALDADYSGTVTGPDHALPISAHYLNMRKVSIFGGSNEIQKNIIARRVLEL